MNKFMSDEIYINGDLYRKAREVKIRRKQLVFEPKLHNDLEEAAKKLGISFNELIHVIAHEWLDGRKG